MRHLVAGHPLGLWIALFGLLSMLVAGGGGQILSLLDWDLAVRLGLQEYDRHSTELAPCLLAQVEWGVCLADAVLVVPLLVAGLVGVLCRRHWGMIAGLRSRIALRVLLLIDQVMSTEMLCRLKLLIETYEERLANGESNRLLAPHQGTRWGTGLSS